MVQYKMQRSVRNQNELLIESVRCEFERFVTPTPLPTAWCVFCAERWTAVGKNSDLKLHSPQILQIWRRHNFFKYFYGSINRMLHPRRIQISSFYSLVLKKSTFTFLVNLNATATCNGASALFSNLKESQGKLIFLTSFTCTQMY